MRRVFTAAAAMLLAACLLAATAMAASRVKAPEEKVSGEDYLCAWLALASYDDRVGQLARSELAAYGYTSAAFREDSDAASAKYFLWTREEPGQPPRYLLSVMGTASWKDVQSDLSLRKVPFAGTTPAEFAQNAARADKSAVEPLAHNGFVQYVQTGFFTAPDANGQTIGESLRDSLLADGAAHLTVTGHSLGGAAAVLLAARLLDMGVPAPQLSVVTFGAPACANQAFADHCAALSVDRVILAGDPVKSSLQSFSSAYKQFGRKVVLSSHKSREPFTHEMVAYVDSALRMYHADRIKAGAAPPVATADPGESPLLLLLMADFDEGIAKDAGFVALTASDLMARQYPGLRVEFLPAKSAPAAVAEAVRRARCPRAIVQQYSSLRQRDRDAIFTYTITLQESVLDERGQVLTVQELTTSTDKLPPILASLYNCVLAADGRESALGRGAVTPP